MKRTIISIGLTLAILPNLAFANSIRVKPHDDLLDISGRHERGTLHADVQRSQSFYQYTPEFCALIPDNAGDSVREEDVRGCREHRGTGKQNNCHGLFKDGKAMSFASPSESHAHCTAIWRGDSYGRFPDLSLATRWVCGPDYQSGKLPVENGKCDGNPLNDPANWLEKVTSRYSLLGELALK